MRLGLSRCLGGPLAAPHGALGCVEPQRPSARCPKDWVESPCCRSDVSDVSDIQTRRYHAATCTRLTGPLASWCPSGWVPSGLIGHQPRRIQAGVTQHNCIHPTFQVSLLKPYMASGLPSVKVDDEGGQWTADSMESIRDHRTITRGHAKTSLQKTSLRKSARPTPPLWERDGRQRGLDAATWHLFKPM